jgi:Kef-type K+ transport system membrane component KefB
MVLPENLLPLDPISDFVLVMFMILLLPKLLERIKLPGIMGLLLGGFILGPTLIGILTPGQGVMGFLADVGKLMVMFFAGLEIDFDQFFKSWRKSMIFGFLTFIIPLSAGIILSLLFDFSLIPAVLIGSLLASHTLISLPILIKYKVVKREAVAVTVGATIFTDIASLMVLSMCVSLYTVGFSLQILSVRLLGLIVYLPLVLFGAKWLADKYFRWMEENEDNKTIMMLFIMTLAAAGAELIHLEGIVGAFIGGLAVNKVLHGGGVKQKLETLGNTLFIPMFFLIIGAMIDPSSFAGMRGIDYFFAGGMIILLVAAKFIAAKFASFLLRYKKHDSDVMWSLSIPQVAATLAAALVAYQTVNLDGDRLISKMVFDAILMLMAVTTVIGPILTEHFVKKLPEGNG